MAAAERPAAAPREGRPASWERLPADIVDHLPRLVDLIGNPPPRGEWVGRAVCRGMGEALFFPESGANGASSNTARWSCNRCPVRLECLAYALRLEVRGHRYGIWGGTNGRERGLVEKAIAAGAHRLDLSEECPAGHRWADHARRRVDGARECRVCFPRGPQPGFRSGGAA